MVAMGTAKRTNRRASGEGARASEVMRIGWTILQMAFCVQNAF
jgi:hypothetical protein